MKRPILAALFVIIVSPWSVQAQESKDEFSKKLLKEVEAKLKAHREDLLKQVEKMLDQKLGTAPSAPQDAAIDNQIRKLEEELAALKKRQAAIEAKIKDLREQAAKSGGSGKEPGDEMTLQEADKLFNDTYENLLRNRKFDEAIVQFQKVFERFPKHSLGYTSAYNIACIYSLKNEKKPALEWLEKAIKNGFRKYDHMEQDTDLDNIRNEPEYQKILDHSEDEE